MDVEGAVSIAALSMTESSNEGNKGADGKAADKDEANSTKITASEGDKAADVEGIKTEPSAEGATANGESSVASASATATSTAIVSIKDEGKEGGASADAATPAPEAVADGTVAMTVTGAGTVTGAEVVEAAKELKEAVVLIPGTSKIEVLPGLILRDDTEDIDDTMESEHFDTRQSFLNLCQGNHYQFDQLRRAKHTSMMVLYHMHNPDAPKFVPNCTLCHADILVGYRYHCDPCDIDICHACISVNGSRSHIHPLRATPVAGAPVKTLTPEQRRERQRAIELHLQLLLHAAQCVSGKDCRSRNCLKMKVIKILNPMTSHVFIIQLFMNTVNVYLYSLSFIISSDANACQS
jgi:hypothetical protein